MLRERFIEDFNFMIIVYFLKDQIKCDIILIFVHSR